VRDPDSGARPSGQRVAIGPGRQAFVPSPLPPELVYSPELVAALSQADRALGEVNGLALALPGVRLLTSPFMAVEAALSSRIEGTRTTLEELLQAEVAGEPAESDDTQEVLNCLHAMEEGIAALVTMPLSLRLVRNLHATLMRGVRGGSRGPGEWRRTQVFIGRPGARLETASYVPPPADRLTDLLSNWEGYVNDTSEAPPLVQCAVAHAQFEMIHPFLDGNGRVGRLLIVLFLLQRRCLSEPLLFLSAYFERHRRYYYDHLRGVSERGEWEEWLLFFLHGLSAQCQWAMAVGRRALDLRTEAQARLAEQNASALAVRLVDLLLGNPYVTIGLAASKLGTTYPTATRAIRALEQIGFVTETTGRRRDRRYCATAVLSLLRSAERADDDFPEQPEQA
jgi:Fic family protein